MYLHVAVPLFVWQGYPPFPRLCHTLSWGTVPSNNNKRKKDSLT